MPANQPSRTCRPAARRAGESARGLLVALAAALMLTSLCGCQRPLFPRTTELTQFDSYDRRRYRLPPRTVTDPFGHEQPNLRERLRPDR